MVLVFVTGIIRSSQLKGGKIEDDAIHSIWSHMLQFKFVLTLLLTPLIYPMTFILVEEDERTISDALKSKIQFWVVIILSVQSTLIKYWREEICLNFTQDSVVQKCKQLESRLNRSRASEVPLDSDDDG